MTAAKLAPEAVAESIREMRPGSPSGSPPTAKAIISTKGSAHRIAPMTNVRRRLSCRTSSTRTGSVRPAR